MCAVGVASGSAWYRKRKRLGLAALGVNISNVDINCASCPTRRDLHIDERLRLTGHCRLLEYLAAYHCPDLQRIGCLPDKSCKPGTIVELPYIIARIGQQASQHTLLTQQRPVDRADVASRTDNKIGPPLMINIGQRSQSGCFGALVVPPRESECVWLL